MAREPTLSVREVPAKSTLFCPDCGHRAPFDGDWVLDTRARDTRYRCPECETTITVRESFADAGPRAYAGPFWQLWGDSVRVWRDFWREMNGAA